MVQHDLGINDVKIIFTDIVKYSIRSTTQQEKIIIKFTDIVKSVIDKRWKTEAELEENVILIPTGDGMAIGLIEKSNLKLHIDIIEEISKEIDEHNSSIYCEVFLDKGWCHCHSAFHIRTGVSEGKAIIYSDINKNKNIAGIPINEAARIMNIADGKQVLFSELAYKNIKEFHDFNEIENLFSKHEDIEVKHGIKLNVYQYLGSNTNIDNSIPGTIDRQKYNVSGFHRRSFFDYSDTAIEIAQQFVVKNQLDILSYDTRWVFLFLPSIVYIRSQSKQVRVLCPASNHSYEKQRVALLVRLGCEVKHFELEENKPPEMFIFDPKVHYYERAIIFRSDNIYSSRPFATYYDRGYDKDAISLFSNSFENKCNAFPPIKSPNKEFKIENLESKDLIERLKKCVYQYGDQVVEISIEEIPLDSIFYIVTRLYEWKLIQAKNIVGLYSMHKVDLFKPLNIEFEENKFSTITPPVIEVHNGKYVALNGSHRVYYCRRNGIISKLNCIVVRGVKQPLPGIPIPYERITIDQSENSSIPRVVNFNFDNFRHIESGIHPLSEVSL